MSVAMPFARLSRMFVPQNLTHSTARIEFENVHQLLESFGFIRHCAGAGLYHFLPLGHRVLDKVVRLIDEHMTTPDLTAQRIRMPSIVPSSLWKATGKNRDCMRLWKPEEKGRWEDPDLFCRLHQRMLNVLKLEACGSELLKFADRHGREMVLNPTHEEAITNLLARVEKPSHRNYPLRLYQITSKFRDEMKPRFGLMRAREFIMKDLYSFDVDDQSARRTYEVVRSAYRNFFRAIGVPFVEVAGDTGIIGGAMSHEFHIVAEVGEDDLKICRRCSQGYNSELGDNQQADSACVDSQKHDWENRKGIEVGHAFLLGDRYSAPLKATFRTSDGKSANLVMGCYGLGVSRLLSAVLEGAAGDRAVGKGDEPFLRWPLRLAPYLVMLIPPKSGSKESKMGSESLLEFVGSSLVNSGIVNQHDVIIDDRADQTIGKRLLNARRLGIPLVIVAGRASAAEMPKFEVVDFTCGPDPKTEFLTALEVKSYFEQKLRSV